jgi:hypothetical protein
VSAVEDVVDERVDDEDETLGIGERVVDPVESRLREQPGRRLEDHAPVVRP